MTDSVVSALSSLPPGTRLPWRYAPVPAYHAAKGAYRAVAAYDGVLDRWVLVVYLEDESGEFLMVDIRRCGSRDDAIKDAEAMLRKVPEAFGEGEAP